MTTNYQNQMRAWMTDWNKKFEEMQVQFALGKMDAVESFEKQKDQMRQAIVAFKVQLDKVEDLTQEQVNSLKAKAEALQVQLSLGKADGIDYFDDQRKLIEHAVDELKAKLKDSYNKNFDKALELFDHNATAFKTGLEIVRLQFALGKMNAKDEAEKSRKEIANKIAELNKYYLRSMEMMQQNMQDWGKQWEEQLKKSTEWWQSIIKK
jgi:hypothetical protein